MTGIVVQTLHTSRPDPWADWRWLRVRTTQGMVTAADALGCREGEQVILVSGETARYSCPGCPGDWCVAGVLAETGNNG